MDKVNWGHAAGFLIAGIALGAGGFYAYTILTEDAPTAKPAGSSTTAAK